MIQNHTFTVTNVMHVTLVSYNLLNIVTNVSFVWVKNTLNNIYANRWESVLFVWIIFWIQSTLEEHLNVDIVYMSFAMIN